MDEQEKKKKKLCIPKTLGGYINPRNKTRSKSHVNILFMYGI